MFDQKLRLIITSVIDEKIVMLYKNGNEVSTISKELKLSSASENLFLSFLCIFPLITIALSISFTIKNENYLQGKSDSQKEIRRL